VGVINHVHLERPVRSALQQALQVEADCLTADSQCTAALNDRPIKYIVCLPLKDVI